jgi:hypothetical protein
VVEVVQPRKIDQGMAEREQVGAYKAACMFNLIADV